MQSLIYIKLNKEKRLCFDIVAFLCFYKCNYIILTFKKIDNIICQIEKNGLISIHRVKGGSKNFN